MQGLPIGDSMVWNETSQIQMIAPLESGFCPLPLFFSPYPIQSFHRYLLCVIEKYKEKMDKVLSSYVACILGWRRERK